MNDMDYIHIHQWETSGAWGVIIGVSKCVLCGKVSEPSDFPTQSLEAPDDKR